MSSGSLNVAPVLPAPLPLPLPLPATFFNGVGFFPVHTNDSSVCDHSTFIAKVLYNDTNCNSLKGSILMQTSVTSLTGSFAQVLQHWHLHAMAVLECILMQNDISDRMHCMSIAK